MAMKMLRNNSSRCLDGNATLPLDTACLSIINKNDHSVTAYSIPDECYVCNGLQWAVLGANSNTTLEVSTRYPMHMYFVDTYEWCHLTYPFKEYGHYGWNLSKDNCTYIYTIYDPPNPYFPILTVFMILLLLAIISSTSSWTMRTINMFSIRFRRSTENGSTEDNFSRLQEQDISSLKITKSSTRIHSLDTFRGISVLLMIFVNNGGGKYVFFNHSVWNGLTVADLVLPWFAWIIGFTLFRSVRNQLRLSVSRQKMIVLCLRRTVVLILLGLMINSLQNADLYNLRLFGVLQLLAISYFVCAFLEIIFNKPQRSFEYGRFMFLEDILDSWPQWIIIISITVARTLILFLLPIPGCPTGYMGPGGYHLRGKYMNCTGGAVGYVDRLLLGNHIYNKTNNAVYGHILPHDPEGIMNTMAAILIVYLGVQAGRIITYYRNPGISIWIRMFMWFAISGLIAGILCNFSKESGIIPVNKKMMSLSFILTTSSFAFLLYTFLYYIVDCRKYWNGGPFIYAGANPILLYVGHYFTKDVFPWAFKISTFDTHTNLLLMNLWTTILWALIAKYLYIKDIFITV